MNVQGFPPRNPSAHPDRSSSNLGIVNPVELALKRCATSETDAVQASIRAHSYAVPYQRIPKPMFNKPVGKLHDGRLAYAHDVELVWNDKLFIDWCFGQGAYKSVCKELKKPLEVELLDMAEVLFARVC
jgi:hypothetical protein